MDPRATPWRVLEDEAPAPDPADSSQGGRRSGVPRAAIAGGAAAILLAIGAFVVAFGSGGSGTVAVEGAAALGPPASHGAVGGAPIQGASASGRLLFVEIVGAVVHPGVFHLAADARVGDLVAAAGGFGPRVDTDRAARELNLAASLHDGDQVRVPSRDDGPSPPRTGGGGSGPPTKPGAPGPVSLNRATAAELDGLPGIGPVTAAKIIASRESQPFTAIDDLRTRKLLGQKTFDALKDLVTVP